MSAAAAIAEEDVEQSAEVASETAAPEAAAVEGAAAEGGAQAAEGELAEGLIPEVGKPETQIVEQPTPSEQAYGSNTEEVTPSDRNLLMATAMHRMAASVGPFVLACSNRREEIHKAVTQDPSFVATLGKLAFGELLPGVSGKSQQSNSAGMSPAAGKLVEGATGKSAQMKKTLGTIGKVPMINFNVNFGEITAAETSEELVDQLGTHVADSNSVMRGSLDGASNEELASLCAAFDPKQSTVSLFEDFIDRELSKLSTDGGEQKSGEEDEELDSMKATKELAYVGDPSEGDQNALAVVERDPKEKGEDKNKVVDMVPDEMKEMAISKHGAEPGTLYQDEMYRRA